MSGDEVFYMKTGDTAPKFRGQLLDDSVAVDLSAASTARLKVSKDGLLLINGLMTIETPASTGWVNRAWSASTETASAGTYRCEVEVLWNDGKIQTFPAASYGGIRMVDDLD